MTDVPGDRGASGHYRILGDHTEAAPSGEQVLAEECAVAISYNGINHAVMMATPADLEDFALGYSLTSGVITGRDQLLDIRSRRISPQEHSPPTVMPDATELELHLSLRALHRYKQQRRAQAGTSGCGVCGAEALEQAFPPLPDQPAGPYLLPPLSHLRDLRSRFQREQQKTNRSGAMHAALYVDEHGHTRVCREDIGRHNALDKLIGACMRNGVNPARGYFAITSRCSVELVQKIARYGGGTLVSLASPTQLGVSWAQHFQINLIHLPSQSPPRLYSPQPDSGPATSGPDR